MALISPMRSPPPPPPPPDEDADLGAGAAAPPSSLIHKNISNHYLPHLDSQFSLSFTTTWTPKSSITCVPSHNFLYSIEQVCIRVIHLVEYTEKIIYSIHLDCFTQFGSCQSCSQIVCSSTSSCRGRGWCRWGHAPRRRWWRCRWATSRGRWWWAWRWWGCGWCGWGRWGRRGRCSSRGLLLSFQTFLLLLLLPLTL